MHHIDEWEIRDAVARPMRLTAGTLLRVSSGRVWLTVEHGNEDIWLLPEVEWRATQPVRVWLSADPTATLQRLTPAVGKLWARSPGGAIGSVFHMLHHSPTEPAASWLGVTMAKGAP